MPPSRYPVTDPLHDRSGPDTFWTTVNAAEALPGVSTPLNWSVFGDAVERAFRWTFVDMGVLHPAAVMVSASVDDRLWGIFYGRAAANLDTFRRLADLTPGTSGEAIEASRAGEREAATASLLAALPAAKRPAARLLLAATRRYIPLREVGKTAFLQTLDTARAAARLVGEDLARRGVVGDPEGVFYLTVAEVLDATVAGGIEAGGIKDVVAFRRERRDEYLTVKLPESWTGQPEAIPITASEAAQKGTEITGLAVSPGVVEGRARVILDPLADDPLEPGEVLVCETTDPSWTSLFLVAAGLVIDVGGPLSHGAILARELGVPCVINSRIGTAVLRTGDLLRVDGDAGRVEVLDTASS